MIKPLSADRLRGLRDLEEQTPVGMIFLDALMKRQRRLSLTVAIAFAAVLAVQPLVAWLWPPYSEIQVLGIPLPWLVLGVLGYPAAVGLGFFYLRRAEAIDDEFSELLE